MKESLTEQNRIADAILDARTSLSEIDNYLKSQDFTKKVKYKVFILIGNNYRYKVLGLSFFTKKKPSPDFIGDHLQFFIPFFSQGHKQLVFYNCKTVDETPKTLVWMTNQAEFKPEMNEELKAIKEKLQETAPNANVDVMSILLKIDEEEYKISDNYFNWKRIDL